MAYAQWIYMIVQSLLANDGLTIKNVTLNWGKFYKWDNKDDEIPTSDVEGMKITAGEQGGIASCGRSDASSGTEGSYDIYDDSRKVCHIYWSCPWGSKTNTFTVSDVSSKYLVQATGHQSNGGASGTVTIKVIKIPS